jgi:hypothetical protein
MLLYLKRDFLVIDLGTNLIELSLPATEFKNKKWGCKVDLLSLMSFVRDFASRLDEFLNTVKYISTPTSFHITLLFSCSSFYSHTRFLRRNLHKLHVQIYITLRSFAKVLNTTLNLRHSYLEFYSHSSFSIFIDRFK